MKIQIIPSKEQPILRRLYGCELWKTYNVVRIKDRCSSYKNRKRTEWREYYIEVTINYKCNFYGHKTTIRIKENEFKTLSA